MKTVTFARIRSRYLQNSFNLSTLEHETTTLSRNVGHQSRSDAAPFPSITETSTAPVRRPKTCPLSLVMCDIIVFKSCITVAMWCYSENEWILITFLHIGVDVNTSFFFIGVCFKYRQIFSAVLPLGVIVTLWSLKKRAGVYRSKSATSPSKLPIKKPAKITQKICGMQLRMTWSTPYGTWVLRNDRCSVKSVGLADIRLTPKWTNNASTG